MSGYFVGIIVCTCCGGVTAEFANRDRPHLTYELVTTLTCLIGTKVVDTDAVMAIINEHAANFGLVITGARMDETKHNAG